jgi:hypothetical protein
LIARATFWVVRIAAATDSGGVVKRSSPAAFGTTRVCPSACGMMSMNASVSASSYTLWQGISPRMIRAKMLSLS